MTTCDHVTHAWYRNEIPEEVARALEDLYQSAFAVKEYFRIYKDCSTYDALVMYDDQQQPVQVFVYRVKDRSVTLLNELCAITHQYLDYFVDFIFSSYRTITTINLNRLNVQLADIRLPYRIWRKSEDVVIRLPSSLAEYQASLGRHTKSNLRNYTNRLLRIYPDFSFTTANSNDLDTRVVSRILAMNRLRMAGKNIKSGFDAQMERRILEFSEKYGHTGTISIDGRIVAGTLSYEVGDHCYLEIISHDPAYNKDRVGQVCLYLTIQHAIQRGMHAFHLLWGKNDYKYLFQGVDQSLYSMTLYRSERHKLFGLPTKAKYKFNFLVHEQLPFWCKKHVISRFKSQARA